MQKQMTVRRMAFEFPADMPVTFIDDDPQMSYVFVGTWMLLPYLEPFLMKAMRKALPQIKDEQLRADLQDFCQQEGQHYQQHARANEVVRQLRPGFAKLAAIEKEIASEYESFLATKSLRFNLAYAEGFEGMTAAGSRAQMQAGLFNHMTGPLRDLMLWHIMEELEHRTVAFEVYEAIAGRGVGAYFYRLFVGLWAQWHFMSRGLRLARCMMEADPEGMKSGSSLRARWARLKRNTRYSFIAIPKILGTYMPWYHPRKVALPSLFFEAQQRFTQQAEAVR